METSSVSRPEQLRNLGHIPTDKKLRQSRKGAYSKLEDSHYVFVQDRCFSVTKLTSISHGNAV